MIECFLLGFFYFGITEILGQVILCCGGCSVLCRTLSCILGLSPKMPIAHLSRDHQKCLLTLPDVPCGAN